jgi:V-type H+-transporting ATPase subunit a
MCVLLLHCCFLQGKLEELEAEMLEVNGNSERLARSYNELVELQLVLEKAGSFFDQARSEAQAESFGDRSYSVPEAMDAPLLESALPVSRTSCSSSGSSVSSAANEASG